MPACPHCGKDTNAESPAPAGSLAAGDQLYRTRHRGVRILPGEDTRTEVTFDKDSSG